ncbi:MAG: class I SAM-dependent methyltransferase, partial [Alphaproteobacteria bacterium]|nr:class I SAM-dependent methyltransferase [Alphaproteobacteria bacterium]
EYDESGFSTLVEMQSKHFWYLGRHRFLLRSLRSHATAPELKLIDLGGGVGGWVQYLMKHEPKRFTAGEVAMGDSSAVAVAEARKILPDSAAVYQTDLMNLGWKERWDVIFLLDVIEHCPDDTAIMRQVYEALKPGGKVIVATPAFMAFWSHNDDFAQHLRRYTRGDYRRLAAETGFSLRDSRYFMFFLSPLYWLSRKTKGKTMTAEQLERAIQKEHQTPHPLLNWLLGLVFKAETPVGHWLRFPWGTSVLGVFEKPRD